MPLTKHLNILCVDDEPAIRALLALSLQRHGHQVATASDGLEAWGMVGANAHAFRLIVTDHEMPKLTGLELVRRLRGSGYDGTIFVFSGSITPAVKEKFLALGVSAVIPKGSPAALLNHVRQFGGG